MRTCVILCGGKSSRFGRDKTLENFGDFPTITHYVFSKISAVFDQVFVSAKTQKFNPKLPILLDENREFSPMGALASLLKNFKDEKIFVIPADMPFVEIDTIFKLWEESRNVDICIAQDEAKTHNLCGFFNSNLANLADEFFKNGNHKIATLIKSSNFKEIKFKNSLQFHNINFFSDYEIAEKILNQGL